MANTNVRVTLTADPTQLERGFKSAAASASVFERELRKVENAERRQVAVVAQASREMEADFASRKAAVHDFQTSAGTALLGFGAAAAVGLGLAAKAASEWETAFAGVRKVVDGSEEEIAALETQLRGLAKVLPASATEIAGVAEAAGQLGVARQDIASFTQTMIALGVSTNLTSDEAATSLAQLGNIMGVLPAQAGRAGAALVALGNDGASTEADIVAMGLRIAGAGKQIGLSEAEVLGFANALASLGIEAEAGGSAISRVMLDIQQAVVMGGAKLNGFAKVAGVSADQFAESFRTNAAGAVSEFIAGLGRMSENGENTVATLGKLGLSEIRVRDTLLRTSSASDALNKSLETGRTSWEDGTALLEEASKRYDTSASKIQIARNQINDAAIDLGAKVLPAFVKVIGAGGSLADTFTKLPGPVKDTAAALGVAAVGIGLVGGAALIAIPKVAALLATLDAMGGRGAKAAGGMRRALSGTAGFLAGPWGVALSAATIGLGIWATKQGEARQRVSDLKDALDQQTGALTEQAKLLVFSKLRQDGVVDSAKEAGVSLGTLTEAAIGNAEATARLNAMRDAEYASYQRALALAPATAGTYRERVQLLSEIIAATTGSTGTVGDAVAAWEDEQEALGKNAEAAGEAAEGHKAIGDTAKTAAQDVDQLVESLNKSTSKALDARAAARDYQDALDGAAEAAKENGKTLRTSTEKGRENAEALDRIAEAAGRQRDAMIKAGKSNDEVREKTIGMRKRLIEAAVGFGMSEEAARRYARKVLDIPNKKETKVKADTAAAEANLRNLWDYLSRIDGRTVSTSVVVKQTYRTGPGAVARATGGAISGPGTGTSDSIPALLSNGEHVWTASEVSMAGGQSAMYRMRAALRSGAMPRFASGGAVGKSEKERKEAEKEERERLARVRDLLRELRVEIRRGSYLGQVRGGLDGAYSAIDELRDQSRNPDLSRRDRRRLSRLAGDAEPALKRLYRQAEAIDKKLESAKDRLEQMTQLRGQVASGLSGRFSLADQIAGARTQYDKADGTVGTRIDVRKISGNARAYAGQLRTLAGKLDRLRKLGMPGALLQELAGMDPAEAIPAADSWIALGAGEIRQLAGAFAGINKYASAAGDAVVDGMYKGGIDGGKALIKGLKEQESDIDKEITRIGKKMRDVLLDAFTGKKSGKSKSASVGSRATFSVAAGASAASGGVSISQQFVLDNAAAMSYAGGVAVEAQKQANRALATMNR